LAATDISPFHALSRDAIAWKGLDLHFIRLLSREWMTKQYDGVTARLP
jgi:hypothetical protein